MSTRCSRRTRPCPPRSTAKVTKLENELAEVNVKYEGEHRLLEDKSAQNLRLQEQLDTVMARFLAKF